MTSLPVGAQSLDGQDQHRQGKATSPCSGGCPGKIPKRIEDCQRRELSVPGGCLKAYVLAGPYCFEGIEESLFPALLQFPPAGIVPSPTGEIELLAQSLLPDAIKGPCKSMLSH